MARLNEIKAERIRSGFTQSEMAKIIGCSPTTYNAKEKGKSAFTVVEANKFCNACGIYDPQMKSHIFFA